MASFVSNIVENESKHDEDDESMINFADDDSASEEDGDSLTNDYSFAEDDDTAQPLAPAGQSSAPNALSDNFTVHVKIGRDNSVQILDSKPQQKIETNNFFDIISTENRLDDVYIAISVNKTTCINDDDSCIEHDGANYKMDL